jgi:hypothetical protein
VDAWDLWNISFMDVVVLLNVSFMDAVNELLAGKQGVILFLWVLLRWLFPGRHG